MGPFDGKTEEEKRAIINKGIETRRKNKIIKDKIKAEAKINILTKKEEINALKKQIKELKEERKKLTCYLDTIDKTMILTGKTLLDEETIVKGSTRWSKTCGVYFLIAGTEVVYVGQSVNIYGRIAAHSKEKDFNAFAFIQCKREMLDKLESLYIHTLRPKLNGENHQTGRKIAPLNLETIFSI